MKYVIFDIDGTLANTKEVDDKCFVKAFEQTFGINIRNQKWEELKNVTDWGITEEIIQREFGREPSEAEYERMSLNLIANLREEKNRDETQFNEINGAKHFFEKLRKTKNIELGIGTGAWGKSAKIKLEAIGIDIKGICFSNSDYHKSREEITKHVIHQLNNKTNKSPDEIIYFGDGEWDFKTCENLGIRFIGIDVESDGKLEKLGAKMVFQNYDNIEQIIKFILLKAR